MFIFGCAGSSLLRGLFSSEGYWLVAVLGLLTAVASPAVKYGLYRVHRLQEPLPVGSVFVPTGL